MRSALTHSRRGTQTSWFRGKNPGWSFNFSIPVLSLSPVPSVRWVHREGRERTVKLRVSQVDDPVDAQRWIKVLRTSAVYFHRRPPRDYFQFLPIHRLPSRDDRGVCFALRPDALLCAPLGQREQLAVSFLLLILFIYFFLQTGPHLLFCLVLFFLVLTSSVLFTSCRVAAWVNC